MCKINHHVVNQPIAHSNQILIGYYSVIHKDHVYYYPDGGRNWVIAQFNYFTEAEKMRAKMRAIRWCSKQNQTRRETYCNSVIQSWKDSAREIDI